MKKIIPIALLLFIHCTSTGININMFEPAQDVLWGVKKIAIAGIKGDEKVSSDVASLLYNKIKQTNYFLALQPDEIESKLVKAKFKQTDLLDLTKAKEISLALDVDGLIYAEIASYQVQADEKGVEQVRKSVWTGEYLRDVEGKIVEEMIDGQMAKKKLFEEKVIDQKYVIRRGVVNLTFHIIDGLSGNLSVATNITKSYDSGKVPIDEIKSLPNAEKILRDLASEVITEFVYQIAPRPTLVKRKILSGEGFIEEGKIYASSSLWNEAIDTWMKAERSFPNNSGIYYNLGLAYEAIGEYRNAEAYYRKAILLKEDKLFEKALKNLRKYQEKKDKKLMTLLKKYPPQNFLKEDSSSTSEGERK